jgi:NADH-quinone oxidoreductase subunit J
MVSTLEVLAQTTDTGGGTTGETVLFWLLAPITVLAAVGLVISRRAVHGALFLAVVMISLAVFFIALEAPFLGVVQIVVYTGAIMMLFLFVIMLVGVDASDSRVETIRGQRVAAALAGLGLGALLVSVVSRALFAEPIGLGPAAPEGTVPALADAIFSRYVWAFEIVAATLITAALGAMVLTHRERLLRKPSQRELAEQRFASGSGIAASQLPSPGVYARHNAVDTPALLPDGTVSEQSVPNSLSARGAVRDIEEFTRHEPGELEGGEQ